MRPPARRWVRSPSRIRSSSPPPACRAPSAWRRTVESEAALAELRRAAAARPNEPTVAYLLAGQLVQMKRYEEALTLLNGPLAERRRSGVRACVSCAAPPMKRWTASPRPRPNCGPPCSSSPTIPTVLNYLGYLWVDGGTPGRAGGRDDRPRLCRRPLGRQHPGLAGLGPVSPGPVRRGGPDPGTGRGQGARQRRDQRPPGRRLLGRGPPARGAASSGTAS